VSRVIARVRAYRPETSMVRRGSAVRVRERASGSSCGSAPFVVCGGDKDEARRPPSVHEPPRCSCTRSRSRVVVRPHPPLGQRPLSVHGPLERERVEEGDCVFAAVVGEVSVVAVDHRDARAHEAGNREHRDSSPKRVGGVGMAQVVEAADRVNPGLAPGSGPRAWPGCSPRVPRRRRG
jgi:hypothetical protein